MTNLTHDTFWIISRIVRFETLPEPVRGRLSQKSTDCGHL